MIHSPGPGRRDALALHPAGKALAGWWLPLLPERWEEQLGRAVADCRYPIGPVEVTAAALWQLEDWAVELVARLPRGARFHDPTEVVSACREAVAAARASRPPLAGVRPS